MALRKSTERLFQAVRNNLCLPTVRFTHVNGKFINGVTLLGRVGFEPVKIGQMKNVYYLPLYTEHSHKDRTGALKVVGAWHKLIVPIPFLVERICPLIEKGQRLYVEGRLAYRAPVGEPQGNEKNAYVVVKSLLLLEKSRAQNQERYEPIIGTENEEDDSDFKLDSETQKSFVNEQEVRS